MGSSRTTRRRSGGYVRENKVNKYFFISVRKIKNDNTFPLLAPFTSVTCMQQAKWANRKGIRSPRVTARTGVIARCSAPRCERHRRERSAARPEFMSNLLITFYWQKSVRIGIEHVVSCVFAQNSEVMVKDLLLGDGQRETRWLPLGGAATIAKSGTTESSRVVLYSPVRDGSVLSPFRRVSGCWTIPAEKLRNRSTVNRYRQMWQRTHVY